MQYESKSFTATVLEGVAKSMDARSFYEWLKAASLDYIVHDVCITDANEGWFNVSIALGGEECLDVIYVDGLLEAAVAGEYSEI